MVQGDVIQIFSMTELIVGHSVMNDLNSLMIRVPYSSLRDTAACKHLKQLLQTDINRTISLKMYAKCLLKCEIQRAEHSSVEDAIATMRLYKLVMNKCDTSCSGNC